MPRGRKSELAALKRPGGDKGTIKKTKSGKFQPQIFIIESGGQRALGGFSTAEEAAAALASANDKMKKKEPVFDAPVQTLRRGRGTVRCARLRIRLPTYACPHMRSPCADCLCISSRRRV